MDKLKGIELHRITFIFFVSGIIDAGGRNVTVSLQSRTGHTNMLAVVGMLVFTQYWFWFPLAHCLALAFTPTCLITLNAQLKMPKMEFRCNAKPSTFAYPAPLEEKKREDREKVATAVLSIAARAKRKEADRKEMKMEVDDEKEDKKEKKEEKEEKKKKEEEVKKEPEPNFEILSNPARAMKQQLKVLSIVDGSAYAPLKDVSIGGIVMVKHINEGTLEELVEPVAAFGPKSEDEKEPEPPEPFEYIDD